MMAIAPHKQFSVQQGISLLEIVCLITRKNVIFTRLALTILLILIARFSHEAIFVSSLQTIIKQLLSDISEQDGMKERLYNYLTQKH